MSAARRRATPARIEVVTAWSAWPRRGHGAVTAWSWRGHGVVTAWSRRGRGMTANGVRGGRWACRRGGGGRWRWRGPGPWRRWWRWATRRSWPSRRRPLRFVLLNNKLHELKTVSIIYCVALCYTTRRGGTGGGGLLAAAGRAGAGCCYTV